MGILKNTKTKSVKKDFGERERRERKKAANKNRNNNANCHLPMTQKSAQQEILVQ